jgi:hypothetical protein
MKKGLLLLVGMLAAWGASAQTPDTTVVNALVNKQMTWYGAYSDVAVFPPAGAQTYGRIWMKYTLGCATGGCSDWDYTTTVRVHKNNKVWELGRVITPYGSYMRTSANGFTPQWKHDYWFDVTDYVSLLADSTPVSVFYSGYSSGFSADVTFYFIDGAPTRTVLKIDQVYTGYTNYLNQAQFETSATPAKKVDLLPNAEQVRMKITPTGHGFVNALNCAEFCEKNYTLKAYDTTWATQAMWHDDCGLNPIYPQGGTWLYDRANWCPGSAATTYQHLLERNGPSFPDSLKVDLDIEPYTYTVPAGETPAGYQMEAHLIQYGPYNGPVWGSTSIDFFDHEVSEIVSPSDDPRFLRDNPTCSRAIVKIRNNTDQTIPYQPTVRYGLCDAQGEWLDTNQTYTYPGPWNSTGIWAPLEEQTWTLPMNQLSQWLGLADTGYFRVELQDDSFYWTQDINPSNDFKVSRFVRPLVLPTSTVLTTRTNLAASETHWTLSDATGPLVRSRDNLPNNSFVYDTLTLPTGCYVLDLQDRGKDGFSFWANTDGDGYLRFRNNGGSLYQRQLPKDFGTSYRFEFTTGAPLGSLERAVVSAWSVQPNPARDAVDVEGMPDGALLRATNAWGQPLPVNWVEAGYRLDVSPWPSGMYWLQWMHPGGSQGTPQKLVIAQ